METKLVVFSLANILVTLIIYWGIGSLIREIKRTDKDGNSLLREAFMEKTPVASTEGMPEDSNQVEATKQMGSFSRIAGGIGSIGLAAVLIGIGYWMLYALFFDINSISKIDGIWQYFLAGSALFLPYGFNRMSGIFSPGN